MDAARMTDSHDPLPSQRSTDPWQLYRALAKRQWRAIATFLLATIPSVFLTRFLAQTLLGHDWVDGHRDALILIGALPWLAYAGLCVSERARWTCPRCGKHFFMRKYYRDPFSSHCLNCGLPKWAAP
jgi:hypothetical protein